MKTTRKSKINENALRSMLRKEINKEVRKALKEATANPTDEEVDGFDTSYDKIHDDLVNIQREMTKLFADFKQNKINKDQYIAKRKELQKKRDNLEKQL